MAREPARVAGHGRSLAGLLILGLVAVRVTYLATFAPALFYADRPDDVRARLIPFQATIYAEQDTDTSGAYLSIRLVDLAVPDSANLVSVRGRGRRRSAVS